jgi:hypothetical protein
MPEPIATAAAATAKVAGVELTLLVAGFAGSVVTLSYIRELKKSQAVMAVLTGALCAAYLTPVAMHYLSIPEELKYGAGFLIGVVSMHLIPLILAVAERYRNKPEMFDSITKKNGE